MASVNVQNEGQGEESDEIIEIEPGDSTQRKRRKLDGVERRSIPNFGTLRSKVYSHFSWNPEERQWKCNHCSKQYNHSSRGGSASLLNHLDTAHKSLPKEEYLADEQLQSKRTMQQYYQTVPQSSKPLGKRITEERFKKKLIGFYVSTDQPFSIVEAETFKSYTNFCTMNHEKAKLPCETTIKTWITEAYKEEKMNLKLLLSKNTGKISFILDCWTSSNQRAFQGVIACWIDENWKLCHTPIDLTILNGEHTGANLALAFSLVLDDYDLWNKLHGITTDNASNMTTMFKKLDELARGKMLDFRSKDYRVRCLAHVINLSCKEVIRSVVSRSSQVSNIDESEDSDGSELKSESEENVEHNFLASIRKAVSIIRSSPQRREIFEKFCKKSNLSHKNLILDVETRWNSTLLMLCRVLDYKDPFLATLEHLKLERLKLNNDEELWNKVEQLIKLLEPFQQATNMLSQGHSPTLSDTATVYLYLFRELEKLVDGNEKKILFTRSKTIMQQDIPSWLKIAAKAGCEKLKKYYAYSDNLVYVVSTVMDPRYKLNWFKISWKKEFVEAARRKVTTIWNSKYKRSTFEENNPSTSSTSLQQGNETTVGNDKNQISDFLSVQMQDFHKQEDELKRYLAESCTNPKCISTGIVGALDWWKSREMDYPQLSKMAKDFLAVSATGVPVERLFSCGPDLLTSRPQSLKPETIKQCLCLKQWFKGKQENHKLENFRVALIEKLGGNEDVG